MLVLPRTHIIISGDKGWRPILLERFLRLLRNVSPDTLAYELVSRVTKNEMSYLAFKEEWDGIADFVQILEEISVGTPNLFKCLDEGYHRADEELHRLGLAKF